MMPFDILGALALALSIAFQGPASAPPVSTDGTSAMDGVTARFQRDSAQLAQAQTAPEPAPPAIAPAPPPAAAPAAPPVARDPAQVRAELDMWTRVKDTKLPEEIEAFLAAFPDGMLANAAKARLNDLRNPRPAAPQQAAPAPQLPAIPRPSPGLMQPQAAPPSQPFALNRSTITEAQERLYALNYYSGPINGNLGQMTASALEDYQRRVQIAVTGSLNAETMERLRASRPPDRWAALAFSARGGYGTAWGRPNRRLAESDATSACRRNSRGAACKVVNAPGASCAALAIYEARSNRGDRRWGAYAAARADKALARDAALDYCRRDAVVPDKCEITVIVCGDAGT